MRILIAEDDPVSRRVLEALLTKSGYQVEITSDGAAAWARLQTPDSPPLAILDWMMPGVDGVELCRRLRNEFPGGGHYVILVTARNRSEDIVAGLDAGANDYVTKPYELGELRARIQVGVRMIELQQALAEQVRQLQDALAQVKQLQGMLPICSYCKKIRDDSNYWQRIETYISTHSDTRFSHGICPECWDHHVRPQLNQLDEQSEAG